MKIAFITDLHIGAAHDEPQGVAVRENFLKALAFLPQIRPDCLVIGGDICLDTGDRAVYEWVKEEVDKLPYLCYYIAGNHDNAVLMAETFGLTHHLHGAELYYALPLEGHPALFLDTNQGRLSDAQWVWLREYMTALRDSNVLVFMHHPPAPADVPFMDTQYPFRQSEQFLALVRDLPCHTTVVCGHYHAEKTLQRGNLLALLTPATCWQMKANTSDFAIDHYRIGIREINLTIHGLSSEVHYI